MVRVPVPSLDTKPPEGCEGYVLYMKVFSQEYHTEPVIVRPEEVGLVSLGEEVVDSLVLCGADPNRPLNNGDRPIHLACRHNPSVIAALLSGDGARADPGLRDGAGSLPLELAVVGRYGGSVEGLLAGGSDPNAANGAGEPLLAVALLDQLEWGHGVIARALKDHGAIC